MLNISISMSKKRFEIDAWGIILVISGLIMYNLQAGIGLIIIVLGFIKLFWDIFKND